MAVFLFCPNPRCHWHLYAPSEKWYTNHGQHDTKTFGAVARFKCQSCGKTFSVQTFSIDYYAKKKVDYKRLLAQHASSESGRALARNLSLSCGTVMNRIDRIARQGAALHALLRTLVRPTESVCIDGFVSFDVSQFYPNEIPISITSESRFILDLSHATRRRSGTMTKAQKHKADKIYATQVFERGAISRSFRDLVDSLGKERPPALFSPLVIITDEKPAYQHVLHCHPVFCNQNGEHRIAHVVVNSRFPRTTSNPLFPSNYLERELRKDLANHHREPTCFSRNVANGMSRLLCYVIVHNYYKRYRIKAEKIDQRTHAEVAGIDANVIENELESFLTERVFLSRIMLPPTLKRIWMKDFRTPGKSRAEYLPFFAMA